MNEINWNLGDEDDIENQIESLAIMAVTPGIEINLAVFENMEFKARQLQAAAVARMILSDGDYAETINEIDRTKKRKAALLKKRTEVQKKPQAAIARLGTLVTPIAELLTSTVKLLEEKATKWDLNKQQKANEINQELKRQQAVIQEAMDREAEEKGLDKIKLPEVVGIKPDTTTRTSDGVTAYRREVIKIEIEDENQVPRQFCSPDRTKIMAAIRQGLEIIPGVTIIREKKLQTRG